MDVFRKPDKRVPSIYPASVVMLRNNGETVTFWVERHIDAQGHAMILNFRGYEVNSVIRFKSWK